MKRIVSIFALILAFCALATVLTSCENEEPVYKDYTVTITDGLGNPMDSVIVKFVNSDGESKSRVTGKDGIASLKNALAGDYTVYIEKGFSNAVIINGRYDLTADVNTLMLVVRDETKSMDIYGDVPDGSYACLVGVGSYTVPCEADKNSYFVFNAQKPGTYKVCVSSEDEKLTVGYYGIPMFVQSTHRGDGEYDGKSFELIIQDSATPYVLGIDASRFVNATLTVERTGDAPFDPQFAPWTVVNSTHDITKFTLPAGATLTDIDVTDPTVSVTLGDDGYYYTADGKQVYIRLGSVCEAGYLDVPLALIAGLIDANFGQNIGGYVYDENGEFVGKYSYNSMIEAYYGGTDEEGNYTGNCDPKTGVYPLTEELAEAIICHGTSAGWWKPNTANYLFNGVNVVTENAWLFLCCTID